MKTRTRGVSVVEVMVVVAILGIIVALLYGHLQVSDRGMVADPGVAIDAPTQSKAVPVGAFTNDVGQSFVKIKSKNLATWVRENPRAKIVSLTSVGEGIYGQHCGYLILYELQE